MLELMMRLNGRESGSSASCFLSSSALVGILPLTAYLALIVSGLMSARPKRLAGSKLDCSMLWVWKQRRAGDRDEYVEIDKRGETNGKTLLLRERATRSSGDMAEIYRNRDMWETIRHRALIRLGERAGEAESVDVGVVVLRCWLFFPVALVFSKDEETAISAVFIPLKTATLSSFAVTNISRRSRALPTKPSPTSTIAPSVSLHLFPL